MEAVGSPVSRTRHSRLARIVCCRHSTGHQSPPDTARFESRSPPAGASAWTAQRREAYANDQGQPASLVAVTARSNRSKVDKDPAEWRPPAPDVLCRYGAEWTATKLRWGLAVDEAERDRLLDIAAGCGGTDVEFTPPRRPDADGPASGERLPVRAVVTVRRSTCGRTTGSAVPGSTPGTAVRAAASVRTSTARLQSFYGGGSTPPRRSR